MPKLSTSEQSKQNKSRRLVLKLSGEALSEEGHKVLSDARLDAVVAEIVKAAKEGVQIGIVVGGGNFLRGANNQSKIISRTTADQMGMMATIMNGLALADAIAPHHEVRLFSSVGVTGVAQSFEPRKAIRSLEKGQINIYAGGTGNPFFSTDSAASIRAISINADVIVKATKVDGIYDKDPNKFDDAVRYDSVSFDEALEKELKVMDLAAFCQCRDYNVPILVLDLFEPGALYKALMGEKVGTMVSKES